MTTTWQHLNETPLERELRFLDKHIERLEDLKLEYDNLQVHLDLVNMTEDERREIHNRSTDLEIELVLLEACYDRKAKLENL